MIRFAFTLPLLLLIVGCQTSGQGSPSTFFARVPQPAASAKQFWNKTAQLFTPDTKKQNAKADSTEFAGQFAPNRPHSDIFPVNHSSNPLYKPGAIFPSPLLALQETEKDVITVETETSVVTASKNPLQIQEGDSEEFQSLLREIAVVPPEKRSVDDTKLTELLSSFRDEIMDSDFENDYLALLRRRILPPKMAPSSSEKSHAPLPATELAAEKRPLRKLDMVADDDIDDELPAPALKKRLPNRDEPVIAQSTMPISAPVYPTLAQLPGAAPGVVQAAYQSSHVSNSATTGYGAGDWQAPARQAIEQLRYAIEQTPNGRTTSNEMRLRMLEMLLGNKAEAVKPMQSADKTINEFMGNQVLGFAALLDDTAPDNRSKYISASYRFSEGLLGLQTLCPIKLKNVMFVKDWIAYGQYYPHPTQEFYPGEEFIVYMEIENPVVRRDPVKNGFEVCVAISYEIRDSNAKVVAKQDIGKPAEMTLSRKQDYALAIGSGPVPTVLPASLSPGQYHLRINITDMNDSSMQYAEEQIPFKVLPSQEVDSYSPRTNGARAADASPPSASATADRRRTH